MARDALILGASFESLHAIGVARSRGLKVIALDGSASAPGLDAADEAGVVDIHDKDSVLSFLDGRTPAVILPVPIGRALVSIGKMNDLLGLVGVGAQTAEYCTDKYAFSRGLFAKGLRSARCFLAEEVMEDRSLLDGMVAPLIVKPRYGSGSRGVALCKDSSGALARLAEGDIVEECFPGTECGMDGIVKDGCLLVLMLRKKINTLPPACQSVGYSTISREDAVYGSVEPYMQAIVDEIGFENGLIHADIMISGSEVFAIEVSARPSGHSVSSDLVPLATGIDPIELFLECCLDGRALPVAPKVEPLFMGFFDLGAGAVFACPEVDYLKEKYGLVRYVQNFGVGRVFADTVDGVVTERGRFIMRVGERDPLELMGSLLGEFEMRCADADPV